MGSYLVRRFLLMVLTLFGMSVLIFVMLRLVPGDIADILTGAAGISDPKEKAKIESDGTLAAARGGTGNFSIVVTGRSAHARGNLPALEGRSGRAGRSSRQETRRPWRPNG